MTRLPRLPARVWAPLDTTDDAMVQTALEQVVGAAMLTRVPSPWGFSGSTDIATFEDGRSLALKRVARGRRGAHLIEAYRSLAPRILASQVAVPPFVVGLAWPRGPILLVTEVVRGSFGPRSIGQLPEGQRLARSMGSELRRLRTVRTDGITLTFGWRNGSTLRRVARSWLARAPRSIDRKTVDRVGSHIEELPERFRDPVAVLAHGDYCPANVLVDGSGGAVAILDLDNARLADPLLDVAWWGATVWHHHPDVFDVVWPEFLEGAGVAPSALIIDRLKTLAVIRTLESLTTRSGSSKHERNAWINRLARSLEFLA